MKKIILLLSLISLSLISMNPAFSQVTQQDVDKFKGVATGTDTYSVTIALITSTTPADGSTIAVFFTNANTGASTIAVTIANGNTYSAKAIRKDGAALGSGDIPALSWKYLKYYLSGGYYQLINPTYASGAGTVTTFTITPNQGVSGTVSNPTTTPVLTTILGAITPSVSVTSPLASFSVSTTSPLHIGGSSTTQSLTFKTTTGIGTTNADMHFLVGNNGATEAMTILNSSFVGINNAAPAGSLDIKGLNTTAGNYNFYAHNSTASKYITYDNDGTFIHFLTGGGVGIENNVDAGSFFATNYRDGGTRKWQMGKLGDNSFFLYNYAINENAINVESATNNMYLLNQGSGSVGIGNFQGSGVTTKLDVWDPSASFEVYNTSAGLGCNNWFLANNSAGLERGFLMRFSSKTDGGNGAMYWIPRGLVPADTANATVTMMDNGRFGIRNYSPKTSLDVSGVILSTGAVTTYTASATVTAAQLLGGGLNVTAGTVTLTLPTASDLATAAGFLSTGNGKFEFSVKNTSGANVTIAVNTGVTVSTYPTVPDANELILGTGHIGVWKIASFSTTACEVKRDQ